MKDVKVILKKGWEGKQERKYLGALIVVCFASFKSNILPAQIPSVNNHSTVLKILYFNNVENILTIHFI